MIAVPDFLAGAMENWGLIIYRETALLFDPQVSSALNKLRVAEVVVHELAHQVHIIQPVAILTRIYIGFDTHWNYLCTIERRITLVLFLV